jgi:hypothetical protein
MTWRGGRVDRMRMSCVCFGVVGRVRRSRCVALLAVMAGSVLACLVGPVGVAGAAAASCRNEAFRVGRSASLPDCRAYELVTPTSLGHTQALTFTGGATVAIASRDGERLALRTIVPLEPNPSTPASINGARAVFSRNPVSGWEMKSVVAPEASAQRMETALFSPNLSQVAIEWETALNLNEVSEDNTYQIGPIGGPYTEEIKVPNQYFTAFLGANVGTEGIPAFTHVLLGSVDHALSPEGMERSVAEGTDNGAFDLYDWTEGYLHLVNVNTEGSLVNRCGAELGGGAHVSTRAMDKAVSDDGSKIFFTSPAPRQGASGQGCNEPGQLYMRVNGNETVDVSEPESDVHLDPADIKTVRYNGATPSGSKVFFNTETPLTGETKEEEEEGLTDKLFEYDTEASEGEGLKLIARGVPAASNEGQGVDVVISEDGSTVYFRKNDGNGFHTIYRYDTENGSEAPVFVAKFYEPSGSREPAYTNPTGEFLLFVAYGSNDSPGVIEPLEPRGSGHNELYRYDAADGSVMCVSCGEGNAPAEGEALEPSETPLLTADEVPGLIPMSDDGRYVFFQTTARLVPQDTNSAETQVNSESGTPGMDVYEWEAEGTGGCELNQGCTHLLSSGEASGPSTFLGASANGSNVFLESPAQLVPQATEEFPNIYDVRVEGGFAPLPPVHECLSCQGVGTPPPLFNTPASVSFAGAGNPVTRVIEERPKARKRRKRPKGRDGRRRGRGRKAGTAGHHRSGTMRASGRGK